MPFCHFPDVPDFEKEEDGQTDEAGALGQRSNSVDLGGFW
jgi:hypothetical protein